MAIVNKRTMADDTHFFNTVALLVTVAVKKKFAFRIHRTIFARFVSY